MRTLRLRLFFLASIILMVTLACNVPVLRYSAGISPKSAPPVSTITGVKASVDEVGITHVVANYARGSDATADLLCSYPGEDGSAILQHHYTDSEPSKENEYLTSHEFSLLVKKPGSYSVTCSMGGVSKSAGFEITAKEQPESPATETPAGYFELPKLGDFSSAGLWFYFETSASSVENYFIQHCLPGVNYNDQGGFDFFSVAPDGVFSGECRFAYGETLILTGSFVEGRFTEDGKVSFRLDTQAVSHSANADHPGSATNQIVWLGEGAFTSATSASGKATWSGVCTTSNADWVPCGKSQYGSYVEANGTINWVINFAP